MPIVDRRGPRGGASLGVQRVEAVGPRGFDNIVGEGCRIVVHRIGDLEGEHHRVAVVLGCHIEAHCMVVRNLVFMISESIYFPRSGTEGQYTSLRKTLFLSLLILIKQSPYLLIHL